MTRRVPPCCIRSRSSALLQSSCTTVPVYQRSRLAHPTMAPNDGTTLSRDHVYDVHEGATGGEPSDHEWLWLQLIDGPRFLQLAARVLLSLLSSNAPADEPIRSTQSNAHPEGPWRGGSVRRYERGARRHLRCSAGRWRIRSAAGRRTGSYLVDVISAASVDIVSTASGHWNEVRHAGTLGATYKPGDIGVSASSAVSREPDYLSLSGGTRLRLDLADSMATATFGYSFMHDTAGRTGTPFSVFSLELTRHTITGGDRAHPRSEHRAFVQRRCPAREGRSVQALQVPPGLLARRRVEHPTGSVLRLGQQFEAARENERARTREPESLRPDHPTRTAALGGDLRSERATLRRRLGVCGRPPPICDSCWTPVSASTFGGTCAVTYSPASTSGSWRTR